MRARVFCNGVIAIAMITIVAAKNTHAENAAAKTVESPQKSQANAQANITDEMEAYRAILARQVCTVQDLADLLLMYRGEYGKYPSQEKRLRRAQELGLIKSEYKGGEDLKKGILAYSLMKAYKPERGWLFWLTGWERYALRDVQEAGIIPVRATVEQRLSGEQLFAVMTDAEEYLTRTSNWEKTGGDNQ